MKQFLNKLVSLPVELWQSRKLIWKLAKNDFKTKYAGSYLGIIWAFVQPVITILVYWLVFEKGFSAKAEMFKSGVEVPFVVYLTSGLVPWFFFSEAVSSSTNALIEYNYLVKKVVFKISILPLIKILAACFIHVFCRCSAGDLSDLRLSAVFVSAAAHLLQLLYVCACAGNELHLMFRGCLFPGSVPDRCDRTADRYVGNTDHVVFHKSGRA